MPAIVYRIHVTAADKQGRRAPVDVGELSRRRFEDRLEAYRAAGDHLAAMSPADLMRMVPEYDVILAAD